MARGLGRRSGPSHRVTSLSHADRHEATPAGFRSTAAVTSSVHFEPGAAYFRHLDGAVVVRDRRLNNVTRTISNDAVEAVDARFRRYFCGQSPNGEAPAPCLDQAQASLLRPRWISYRIYIPF